MSRKASRRRSFLDLVKELFFGSLEQPRSVTLRRLNIEGLENRRVMDADLANLVGHVFRDTNASGAYEAGEEGMLNAQVQLYRDDGDGVFDASTDTLVTSQMTDNAGGYQFENLALGDYFLRRPMQTIASGRNAGIHLTEQVSSKIHLAALKTVIDDFDQPTSQTAAVDTTNDGTPESSIASGLDGSHTIGGEREILTNFTGTATGPGILLSGRVGTIDVAGQMQGLLLLDATSSAKGSVTLVWDGTDGISSTLPDLTTGLGGVNLKAGGADHLRMKLNSLDLAGASVKITVYTDATHSSVATATLVPRVINGVAESGGQVDYRFNFDGSGATGFLGNADFTSVKAVVMTIDLASSDIDARLEMLGAYGNAVATSDLAVEEVDVSTTKAVDNATPVVGSLINYVLTVTNATTLPNGKATTTATGVIAKDELFTNAAQTGKLTYISDNSGGTFNSATGVWTVGDLAPGQSKTIIVTMRVNDAARPTTDNVIQIVAVNEPDPDTDDWRDNVPITPNYVDIGVTKTVDNATPNHNDAVDFTVTIRNNGSGQAQSVVIADSIAPLVAEGFQFIDAVASFGTYDSATGLWTIPTLDPGQSVTLRISGLSTGCDPMTNTASLSSLGGGAIDVSSANNSASVTVTPRQADIGVTKQVVGTNGQAANTTPSKSNPVVTYQIVVTNSGPDDATSVVVNDPLPAGMVFVSTDGTYDPATGDWDVGSVAVGQTRTLNVTVRLADGAPAAIITNTATVTSLDQCDENDTNDTSSITVSPQRIDLSITKGVNTNFATVGDSVVYTVTVTNSGPQTGTGVSLIDVLPSGVSFASATVSQGSFAGGTGVWTIGTLEVNQTVTLTLTAKVNVSGTHMNTAEIFGADQDDIDSTPSNGQAGEDDIASATFSAADPVPQGIPEPTPQAEPLTKRRFLAR